MKRDSLLRVLTLALMIGSVVFALGVRCWIALSGLNYTPSAEAVAEARAERQTERERAMTAMKAERAEQREIDKQKLEQNRKRRQQAQAVRGERDVGG